MTPLETELLEALEESLSYLVVEQLRECDNYPVFAKADAVFAKADAAIAKAKGAA